MAPPPDHRVRQVVPLQVVESRPRRGQRLDGPDLRIAAIALSRDLTLVTGNVRHFERVPGLRIENWLESA
jgi:tRNA(fMet)-specific endonuclease VapC